MKIAISIIALILSLASAVKADVLIVADEFPAMQALAAFIKTNANIESEIIDQTKIPADLKKYEAIIVYIHRNLNEPAEKAFIDYTTNGGKLIPLHHSISSGKKKNKYWFDFLGVDLPQGDVDAGGYKWIEGVELDIVCLDQKHFITTNKISYPAEIPFEINGEKKNLPSFHLTDSEVYINHVLKSNQKKLLGLKYTDKTSGKTYIQQHAGWTKKVGKGTIIYLLPGHSIKEFQNNTYSQIVLNAILWNGQ
ncbi:MAG: ThuA domain-containing protein [Verrucomicrobiae bacterium]|nr:ThuA domain-containing protein [Verrucomicrobiae bacterium]